MALVLKDRIKQESSTLGTGTVTLAATYDGYSSFASFYSDGEEVYYTISNTETGVTEWEVGRGTYSSGTLARDTVLSSTNSNNLVNFTSGIKEVFVTYPADRAVTTDDIGTIASQDANNVSITGGSIAVTANPTTDYQVATKTYVDSLVSSAIHFHDAVRVESPDSAGNLNATYNNGTAGVGATLTNAGTQAALVIDGVTLNTNDRVLIYNQTDATENGVYTVTDTGSVSTNWVLTRATDADTYSPSNNTGLDEGSYFYVTEGDTGAGESYICNTVGTITFGTTNITFALFSSSLNYVAGTNIDITGTTIALTGQVAIANGGTGASTDSGARTNLGLAIGTNVQAYDADLTAIGALAKTDGNFIVGNGSTWVAESGSTARTSLGVPANDGTGATGTWSISISGNAGTVTDGVYTSGSYANPSWITSLDDGKVLPTMTGNSGKYLTTDGTNSNWTTLPAINNGTLSLATSGTGISGSATFTANQSGSSSFTVTSNATSSNTVSTIVARDASGNFNAGTITAALTGNVTGDVSGNAGTATILQTARTIGGVSFNGSANINLPGVNTAGNQDTSGNAATATKWATGRTISLTGDVTGTSGSFDGSGNLSFATTIAANSVALGTDTTGNYVASITNGSYITGGNGGSEGAALTLAVDATNANTASKVVARDASGNFSAGTITAALTGNASTATTLQTARTINGVSFNGGANITVTANTPNTLTRGTYLTGSNFNGSAATTWAVDATNLNTASKVVARDASGNFSAGTITAALSGNATTATSSTSATTATNATNTAITNDTTTNATMYPTWVTTTTGNLPQKVSSTKFTFNPSTGTVAATSLNATTATVGGILLEDSTDRSGLLEVNRLGATAWTGFQAKFSATGLWSVMGNETQFGLYDDAQNEWALLYTENAGLSLYYNNAVKLMTTDTGVTVTGTATATTFSGALSGNATTATTLQTARTINGVSFNGGANITVEPYIEDDEATDATRYLVFTDNSTAGFKRLNEDSSLTYNPSSGNLTTNGTVSAGSDERWKENWKEFGPNFIDELAQVKHGTYSRIDTKEIQVGVGAQSLQKVIPEAVNVDDKGYLNVAYGHAALASVVELAKEVVKLRAEIAELKSRGK
jgi:hypothetical protein